MVDRRVKHGESHSVLYRRWDGMIGRCYRPSTVAYHDYGAKGVTVCDRWRRSYEAFKADVGAPPTPKHELDRRDNSRGYEPGNVRWVTKLVNMRNRSCTRHVTAFGETKTLLEWVRDPRCGGSSYFGLRRRLDNGEAPEDAITRPLRCRSWAKRARDAV